MTKSISITLDATHLGTLEPTGIERYTTALLPLLTVALQAAGAEISWVGHTIERPDLIPAGTTWLYSPHRPFWSQTGLRQLLAATNPDLFFTPSGIPPIITKVATAFTVHDMTAYQLPQAYSLMEQLRLKPLSYRAALRARRIIVPSHFTKQEVLKYWHLPEQMIAIVPEGFTPFQVEPEAVSELANRPFFLYVGRLERKKNLLPLLAGFNRLAKEQDVRLVLAGRPGQGYSEVQRGIKELSGAAQERIRQLGYVSDAKKRWLYQSAVAGMLPCPSEGFGLPVLDCFAEGTLAICAQAGALPEVGADACLYVQPESPTDWYLQLKGALVNAATYQPLISKGHQYLRNYTWESNAKQTAQALLTSL